MEVTVSMESLNANAEEMQRLRDERDEAARKWEEEKAGGDSLEERYEIVCENLVSAMDQIAEGDRREAALEIERDALAAHVERLIGLGTLVRDGAVDTGMEPDEFWDRMEKWETGSIDTPATSLALRDAEQQAAAIDKWSATIIRVMEEAAAKHAEDPNYPPISMQMIRELCCDMDDDADRLRGQAEALAEAKAACEQVAEGQKKMALMHVEVADDGDEYVGERGIPYSNKALGATHCADDIGRMLNKLRQAEDDS